MKTINEYVNLDSNFHLINEYMNKDSNFHLINEYISNKIKDSSALYGNTFPKTPKLKDVIDFLEDHGFVKMKSYNYETPFVENIENNRYVLEDASYPSYRRGNEYWIRFCCAGKPSKTNPIYFCRLTESGKQVSEDDDMAYVELYFVDNKTYDITFENYKEFVDYVNKEINW